MTKMRRARPRPDPSMASSESPAGAASSGRGQARNAIPHLNKATERILKVLSAMAESPLASHGVTELSQELAMTKNMVFRALATLAEEGYVVRDSSGSRYQLGHRIFALRNVAAEEPDLRTLCAPALRRIHELTGGTLTLSIPVGFGTVVIDGIEGKTPIVTRVMYGRTIPLHAGPGSRAILAFLPDSEIEEFLRAEAPLRRVTPETIVEPDALWAEIRLVRERGYAVGYGDHVPDAAAVAFPVLDAAGRPHGAIAVGWPGLKGGLKRLLPFLPAVRAIIDELNEKTQFISASPLSPAAGAA